MIRVFFPQNLGTWGMTRDGITSHVPNLSIYSRQFGQHITINSHGMRDWERSISKPIGTYRILVLGDSFMEANQVALEEAFPKLLETSFGRGVEVINASVSGWGTDDEITYLTRYGFQFQPDLVLIGMTLSNDLQDNLDEEFHMFSNGHLQEIPNKVVPSFDFAVLKVKEWLASHSHLYQVLLRAKRLSWTQQAEKQLASHMVSLLTIGETPETQQAWDMTRLLLMKMKSETEKNGAKVAVFLIPLFIQVSEERLSVFLKEQQSSLEQVVLDKPQLRMQAIGEEVGIEIIDLLPNFRQVEKDNPLTLYLLNDGHWTAAGHRLAASIVSDRLRGLGVLPEWQANQ
nr:hypothetical protein [Nitrosomonas nitrosa]